MSCSFTYIKYHTFYEFNQRYMISGVKIDSGPDKRTDWWTDEQTRAIQYSPHSTSQEVTTDMSHKILTKNLLIFQFNPDTFLCLSQAMTWISNAICHSLFYVQWVKMRDDCSFCWYWWNCWTSLFKLSFYNQYKPLMSLSVSSNKTPVPDCTIPIIYWVIRGKVMSSLQFTVTKCLPNVYKI